MFRVSHTPPLSYLLDDLLTRDQAAISKHLDVSPATLARWRKADQAPRPVMLALFYESRWGYSVLHTTATNGEDQARRHVDSLSRENAMLRARIARLEALGGFGSANAPVMAAGLLKGLASIATISDAGSGDARGSVRLVAVAPSGAQATGAA